MKNLKNVATIIGKSPRIFVLGMALCLMLGITACGSSTAGSTGSVATTETNATAETAANSSTEESAVSESVLLDEDDAPAQQSSTSYHVGDTVTLDNGISYTITAAGKYTDNQNWHYAYVELDILNESGEDMTVSSSDVIFYGDNYRLDAGTPSATYDKISSETISNGRRLAGRFYAVCNDYDSLSVIEAEIGSVIVVIKDESVATNPSKSSSLSSENSIYGTYAYDDGENGIMTAEIYIITGDDDGDYIYIEGLSYGDSYIAITEGYLEPVSADTYHVMDIYGDCELTLTFDAGGMYVTVENASYEDIEILSGYYTKTEEIDLSQVG